MDYNFYQIVFGLFLAMFLPQTIKIIVETMKKKRFSFSYFFLDGGMPSSHSSFVAALTMGMFLTQGFAPITLLTLAISAVFIRDAYGLRMEVGKQKKVLERLSPIEAEIENLKRQGHTALQVVAGILFGFLIMWLTLIL